MGALFKSPGGAQLLVSQALQSQGRQVPADYTASMFKSFGLPGQPSSTAPPPAFAFKRPTPDAAAMRQTPGGRAALLASQAGNRGTFAAGVPAMAYGSATLGGGR